MVAEWSWVLLVAYGFLAVELAGLIMLVAPRDWNIRILAVLLAVEGLGFGGILAGFYVYQTTAMVGDLLLITTFMLPSLYALWLGRAIDTPWSRPLRSERVQSVIFFVAIILVAAYVGARRAELLPQTTWVIIANIFLGLTAVLGLVAAIAYHGATEKGTVDRARATSYLVAFAARDIAVFALGLGPVVVALFTGGTLHGRFDGGAWSGLVNVGWALMMFTFLFALLYGVLRGHILDLNVHIKWTVKQGTLATVFVTVFFAVSEGASAFFADTSGSTYLGIGIASVLILVLAPLMRMAEAAAAKARADRGFADAVVTDEVVETDERKLLYRDQVRIAWQDQHISTKERAFLHSLRTRLELERAEAGEIELAVMEADLELDVAMDAALDEGSARQTAKAPPAPGPAAIPSGGNAITAASTVPSSKSASVDKPKKPAFKDPLG